MALPGGGGAISAEAYQTALGGSRPERRRRLDEAFVAPGAKAILQPTTPCMAPLIEQQASFATRGGRSAPSPWRTTPCRRAAWVCRALAFRWSWTPPWEETGRSWTSHAVSKASWAPSFGQFGDDEVDVVAQQIIATCKRCLRRLRHKRAGGRGSGRNDAFREGS